MRMDARLALAAGCVAALLLSVDWLFYALAVLLICVVAIDLSAPKPAPRAARGAPSAPRGEPVVIQAGGDATAFNFVGELVNTIVQQTMDQNPKKLDALAKSHAALDKKLGATEEKLSKKIEKIGKKLGVPEDKTEDSDKAKK